ncbi:MAG: MFS transporter [Holosporales bacterium]|jgi:MFS family permease|nr:MFS transporter [Holosporales bacterium]
MARGDRPIKKEFSPSSCPSRKGFFFTIFSSLPRGIFTLSFFGLFLGMSTTMVYCQIGMFLKTELHATEATVALVDGFIEFVSFICRVFAGVISDYLAERKLILLLGCCVTFFARSILATASTSFMVTLIQSVERFGNGFQATTRDALIADISTVDNRGKSYGLSRSLKTIGSFLGIPLSILIMYLSGNNYRLVFLCSAFPVLLSIFCLMKIKVSTGEKRTSKKIENPFQKKYLSSLDRVFWKILLLDFLFELGHFSETLLPIYASKYLSRTTTGSESMFVSLGQVLLSFPVGLYADRFGRNLLIKICMGTMIFANISFIFIPSIVGVYLGAFLWGGQMTAIQGLFLSLISERVDTHIRATAIGLYYCVIGVAFLLASAIAGHIWTGCGEQYAFIYSLVVSCIALCLTQVLLPKEKKARRRHRATSVPF